MKHPLVSVLIPMYNTEKYIACTIESVLKQTYSNIEIIIVDDSSTDNSYQIAEKFLSEKVFLFRNPKKGACAARNYAFEKSQGSYIQYLDADDFCSNDKIEKQIDCLINKSNRTLSFCNLRLMRDERISDYKERSIDKDYKNPIELLIDMWARDEHNCPHCYLMHRELIKSAIGWNENIIKNQDGEFFSRIIEGSDEIYFVPDVYAVWRLTNSGISSMNNLEMLKSQFKVIQLVSTIILNYKNTEQTRNVCSRHLGWFLYLGYLENKSMLQDAYQLLKQWDSKLVIPYKGRLFCMLKMFLGWKIASRIVKNSFVIKICSKIDKRR